jgi:hypothetical protein
MAKIPDQRCAELVRQLHHEERYALRQGYLHIADVLCKSATVIIDLQARVRELEKVIREGLCDNATDIHCGWCERAHNALREA